MLIRIVCCGKLKEKYLIDAVADYAKRISRFAQVECAEVADERIPENAGPAEEKLAMEKEGERMLAKIAPQDYVIAMAIKGKSYTSEAFAGHIDALTQQGKSRLAFVIGGSLGLSDAVMRRADETLSLSEMTFPHRIARVLILEQVYRAFKINRNETYHK